MNLNRMLERSAARYGEKIAIVSGSRRLSFNELERDSNRVANYLAGIGINKGDRLAILLPNNLEYPVLHFGIAKIGGIAVPLDVKYKVTELTAIFNNCQPTVLISEGSYLEPLLPLLNRFKSIKHVIDVSGKTRGQISSYRDILTKSSAGKVAIEPEPDDTALIAYTSGPTFRPRGVVLTHRNLVEEAKISAGGFQQTERDVSILFALPLHHVFGLVGIFLTAVCAGSTVIIIPGLSLSGVMETIEKERVTMFMGVPYVYTLLANMAKNEGISHDLSSIRLWCSSGAPLSESIIGEFKKYFGANLINFWGLSEATCHITYPSVDSKGAPGLVGNALQGWEIRIVDDSGEELPRNHEGEIIARGIPVMKGYYNNPVETDKVLKDGWLYTGDIGRVDDDGYLFITGRKKNMIIRKGQNIYPSDVEDLLRSHPKVADVAVVGVQDSVRGEELRAIIIPKEGSNATEQEIKQFCLEHLANYKVPKQIVLTESLPRTATGEIDEETLQKTLLA